MDDNWPAIAPKNILIKVPNWLGDLVMATAAIADVRRHFPTAKITAMCQSKIAGLLEYDPNIDAVYSYVTPSGWIHRSQHFDIIQEIRSGEYDLGILFTNSFSSAWWFWRGHVKNRLGYGGNLRNWLLNKAVPFSPQKTTQHLVLTYKELLRPLGIPPSDTVPILYLTPEERQTTKELLALKGYSNPKDILLGINPGAAYGSAKCWLPERFVTISKQLLEKPNVYIAYFGDQAGAPLVDSICEQLASPKVLNFAGKTSLRELMALINACSLFLTNDSGPMHVAAALKIPLVALFGSTDDIRTGPYGSGKVIHKHVECSPCYKRVCPIDFRCMTRIEVEEVYRDLEELIERQSKS